jgi:hypothetical protein
MRVYLKVEDMAVGENLKNKIYKIEVFLLKVLPFILASIYLCTTVLDYFMIDSTLLNYLALVVIYSFVYTSSYVFKFCSYHRMPIHYIVIINLLSIYDVYVGIPINEYRLIQMYAIITCIFLFITVYLYVKSNKRTTIKNSR